LQSADTFSRAKSRIRPLAGVKIRDRLACFAMTAPRFSPPALTLAVTLAAAAALAAAPAGPVEFNRDIRVVLSDNCLACHGPDPGSRKAGLRLDTKEGLFGETKKEGPVVAPGKPEASALWKRINQTDPEELMPPPESHKQLKAEDKELFRRWIAEGAPWQPHWAFIPPVRPEVPAPAGRPAANAIDAFVTAKLAEKGLAPNPEADRRTLIRRVTLDLTGLPPSPAEMEAAVGDTAPDWYEQLVRRLLDSPRFGEQRARYWLDAARYADTHGLHFDNYREMWPYRDWVIEAFNRNQPFDQFTFEQIAGDLLENPSLEQQVATGFQRCNMTTNEGGTIEAENLANYANDRVSTLGSVFLGLTLNCSACHDHKFDPVSQKDFYAFAAFFRNTTQTGFDGNVKEGLLGNGTVVVPRTPPERARWAQLPGELEQARQERAGLEAAAADTARAWARTVPAAELSPVLELGDELLRLPLTEGRGSNFGFRLAGEARAVTVATNVDWRADGPLGAAPVLRADATLDLGPVVDLENSQPFSLGGWVRVPETGDGTILGRVATEDQKLRGWDLFANGEEFAAHLVHRWAPDAIKVRTTERRLRRGQWQHVVMTYDGSSLAEGVKLYVDGEEAKVNIDNRNLAGSFRALTSLRVGQREGQKGFAGLSVQDLRVVNRRLEAAEIRALAWAPRLPQLLARAETNRTELEQRAVTSYYLATRNDAWRRTQQRLVALETERDAIRGRAGLTHVQVEKKDSPAMARVLYRGQYDQPRDEVAAATPGALHAFPADAPRNRLGLARWLVAPENPLTARVTVNRFWQELFGSGLVRTSEDFGIMGENPVNQPLLDWLAVEFRESGWDVKRFYKLMVLSAAYRQDARVSPEKLEHDPANRLLSRGPRFRMDAEMVRDYALAASGLLRPDLGGPSVRPYQPEGVWEPVAMPESNTKFYRRDSGSALYRRSLYTFWKRAAPPAFMDILNAPNREVCTVRRERTNTPLQALATLNDPQMVEAARHVAAVALAESRGDTNRALDRVITRILLRPVSERETGILRATFEKMAAHYAATPAAARQLLAVGESPAEPSVGAPQLAALTLVANQLLNLDETLNK
jgi:mono/diheme cytochrome c family protein